MGARVRVVMHTLVLDSTVFDNISLLDIIMNDSD